MFLGFTEGIQMSSHQAITKFLIPSPRFNTQVKDACWICEREKGGAHYWNWLIHNIVRKKFNMQQWCLVNCNSITVAQWSRSKIFHCKLCCPLGDFFGQNYIGYLDVRWFERKQMIRMESPSLYNQDIFSQLWTGYRILSFDKITTFPFKVHVSR